MDPVTSQPSDFGSLISGVAPIGVAAVNGFFAEQAASNLAKKAKGSTGLLVALGIGGVVLVGGGVLLVVLLSRRK